MIRSLRVALACAVGLAGALQAATAAAQCTKDTDCKEARLCEKGVCVEPATVARPKVPPHPYDWKTAYLQVGGLLAPHTWHGTYDGDTGNVGVRGGVHVAVYGVSTTSEHYGGYFSFVDFPGGSQLHAGLTMKEGRRRFTRVWMGGVVDLGAYFLLLPHGGRGYGVELFPRFELDVILGASPKARSALFFAVGPMLVPYFDSGSTALPGTGTSRWLVSIHMLLGILFGS